MTKAIYCSTAPEVLEAWADTQRRYREYQEKVGAFFGRYPNHDGLESRLSTSISAQARCTGCEICAKVCPDLAIVAVYREVNA